MPKQYARLVNGEVFEIVGPLVTSEGYEVPINKAFPDWFVQECVDITNLPIKPDQRWTYDGSSFTAPVGNS